MADIIQIKRGTAASATANNPILADGEFGYETDTSKIKVGDGVTAWNSLPYLEVEADVAAAIIAASSKSAPVDADQFAITDSEAGNALKKLTWANIKVTLKTYFDTLYESSFSKGNIVQGSNVTLTGTLTNRLVGSGDVTIAASGGGVEIVAETNNSSVRIDNLSIGANTGMIVLSGTFRDITGIDAGGINRKIVLVNNSGDFFNVTAEGTASSAENRFAQSTSFNNGASVEYVYSTVRQRWMRVG